MVADNQVIILRTRKNLKNKKNYEKKAKP